MKIQRSEWPDQPEAKIKALESHLSKQVQYRTKGRKLKYLTEFNFNDIAIHGEFENSLVKETVLYCDYGQIIVNDIRTMWPDNTLICSVLGAKYTMKSVDLTGGKIYAFI